MKHNKISNFSNTRNFKMMEFKVPYIQFFLEFSNISKLYTSQIFDISLNFLIFKILGSSNIEILNSDVFQSFKFFKSFDF